MAQLRTPVLLVLLLCSMAAVAAAAPLSIAVDAQSVTVSNVTPRGAIVLLTCSRVGLRRSIGVVPATVLLNDDHGDGTIRYTPPAGVPFRSVWAAVDQSTGQIATAAPPEFPLIVRGLAADTNLKKDVEGEIASLSVDIPRLVLLLVRPGAGVWVETVFDGQKGDSDPSLGRVTLTFEDLVTISGKDKAPKHLRKDDAVVAVDPGHLDLFVAQVGK
jgi:hypothetical protein